MTDQNAMTGPLIFAGLGFGITLLPVPACHALGLITMICGLVLGCLVAVASKGD